MRATQVHLEHEHRRADHTKADYENQDEAPHVEECLIYEPHVERCWLEESQPVKNLRPKHENREGREHPLYSLIAVDVLQHVVDDDVESGEELENIETVPEADVFGVRFCIMELVVFNQDQIAQKNED